jgi:hypothetical protein
MPSDGKSSHCLWQGELKKRRIVSISMSKNCTETYLCMNKDATHNGLAHVESQCDNHFDCDVMINDSLTWCFTSNDYDVQLTYTEYYRCGWGWLTCSRIKERYYTNRLISFCGVMYWDYSCTSKFLYNSTNQKKE